MLNEVWHLCLALERNGFAPPPKHKRVHTPGRGVPCLRVRLAEDGSVRSIEEVDDNDRPSWTVMDGNQNSFPVVSFQEPLIPLPPNDNLWSRLGYGDKHRSKEAIPDQERLRVLQEAVSQTYFLDDSSKTCRLLRRLASEKAIELLQCAEEAGSRLEVVGALAERFRLAVAKSPQDFLITLGVTSVDLLQTGRLNAIDTIEQLLVGKRPPRDGGKRPVAKFQLAFDVADPAEFPMLLYHERTRDLVVRHLPDRSLPNKQKEGSCGIDALTGETAILEARNFSKVDLPVPSKSTKYKKVGRKRFPLISMFSDAQCNKRYGLTDAGVFPLAQGQDTKMAAALEFMLADERKGKTWEHVASGRFETADGRKVEKHDLLIAYVENEPLLDARVARYFGGGSSSKESQFEVDTTAVCDALKGIARRRPKSRLNMFLIREASKGQVQVVLAASPPVTQVLESAERWQAAVEGNLPPITVPIPPETQEKRPVAGRPLPPYPDQVVRLLSHQWLRDGASPKARSGRRQKPYHEVPGPGLGEILSLMLRAEGKWQEVGERLLGLLVNRLSPLLIGLGGAMHACGLRRSQNASEPLSDYPRASRELALQAVAAAGILLDALGSRKEAYMKEAAFLVGQALALADTLHKDYCVVVRSGQLPTSLIGTALMRRALDNPAGALADLAERIPEYIRWAKTAEEQRDWPADDRRRIAVREARKKLRQYQTLAAKLADTGLPATCNDIMKAQLLLGFLASAPEDPGGND